MPSDVKVDYQDVTLTTADNKNIHGWYLPAAQSDNNLLPKQKVKGTVFFLHGNSLNISYYLRSVYWLPENGYNVFLFDYRGFGLSQGEAQLPDIYLDIEAAYQWLIEKKKAEDDTSNLYVLGQSIGGALGSYWLGKQQHPVSGFIVDSSFSSFNNMVQHISSNIWLTWPLQYPIRWSFSSDYNPENYSDKISAPILQFHSPDDQVVPWQAGKDLYQSFHDNKRWVKTYGGHINTFNIKQNRKIMLDFLQSPTPLLPNALHGTKAQD